MPDVLGPECVKMHKTALSSMSSQRSNDCNRNIFLGDSLINVIIGIWTKYSGEQATNPFFKTMVGSHTHITKIKRYKIVYVVKFKSPPHPWALISSLLPGGNNCYQLLGILLKMFYTHWALIWIYIHIYKHYKYTCIQIVAHHTDFRLIVFHLKKKTVKVIPHWTYRAVLVFF